jgi:hypothetical protein
MSQAFLTYVAATLKAIEAEGMMKHERSLEGPQGARV